ncbi:hypothetical protein [Streptomyces lunalinharesii]|uniref:Uncharacterized protein n=1 Tax=Streptomyces lunalinharesii TaxID=333384 RepID=A0ABP6EE62_9ACTN
MDDLKVSVAALAVSAGTPQLVSGEIWCTLGGVDFPGAHWTDAPVSVLGSMGEALRRAASGEAGEVYFFEGPYYLKLTPRRAGARADAEVEGARDRAVEVEVTAVCDRAYQLSGTGGGDVEARCVVPLHALQRHYADVVVALGGWARQHGHAEVAAVLARMAALDHPPSYGG